MLIPGGPVVRIPCFHRRGVWVSSLVGELKILHATWGGQKKNVHHSIVYRNGRYSTNPLNCYNHTIVYSIAIKNT